MKTQFEALVVFVYEEAGGKLRLYVALLHVIEQATGGGKNDLRLDLTQTAMFVHRGASAVKGNASKRRLHRAKDGLVLLCEFTRGTNDERLQLVALRIQLQGKRNEKSERLTRARRR